MPISDLYDRYFIERNADHFAAIVRVAMTDGVINDSEQKFLDRLALNLNIDEAEYKAIMKDYMNHPINAPVTYDHRLERLYDLARMIWADHLEEKAQEQLLRKICIGLGFNSDNVKYIADKALTLVHYEVDLDEFIERMKTMNQ